MLQKKQLELNSRVSFQTRNFFSKRAFVFVLDAQIFYQKGAILKVVDSSGKVVYIPLLTQLDKSTDYRISGLGFVENNFFYCLDIFENPCFNLTVQWFLKFNKHVNFSLFLFCLILSHEVKKIDDPKIIFGLLVHYLLQAFDNLGWSFNLHDPVKKLFKERQHFFFVCVKNIDDLPLINLCELEKAYRESTDQLSTSQENQLKGLHTGPVYFNRKIKIIYWLLQQVSRRSISKQLSAKTWCVCADLLLYYAQSLRFWIP